MKWFKKSIFKVLNVVAFLIVFVLVRACTAEFHNNSNHNSSKTTTHNTIMTNNNISKKQLLKDTGFIWGFVDGNTDLLELYCKDSGYIPYNYINAFNKRFFNTIKNINNLDTYQVLQTHQSEIQKLREQMINIYDNDLKEFQKEYDMNKHDYCKLHDDEMQSIIEAKVQEFKTQLPNYFLD